MRSANLPPPARLAALGLLLACLLTPALPAAAQERAEAWLRISPGTTTDWGGFIQVSIESVLEDGRPLFRWVEEGSLALPGREGGWRESAVLDAEFGLVRGSVRRRSGTAEVDYEFASDGKSLERSCAAAALRQSTPWGRERDAWPPGLVPAGLLRRRAPWEAGMRLAAEELSWRGAARAGTGVEEFVFHERALAVTVLSQGRREIGGVMESCWTIEVAPTDPPGPATTVVIDARGLPVEIAAPEWTARRVPDRAAALAGGSPGQAGRRDPFRPALTPREMRRIGDAARPVAVAPLAPAELRALLERAQDDLAAMRQAATLPEAEREPVLADRSRSLQLIAARIRDAGDPQAALRISEILSEASRHYDPARAALASGRTVFRDLRDSFDSTDPARIARIPGLVQTLQSLAGSPELAGKPEQAALSQLVQEAAPLEKRGRVKLEGYERMRDRRASGVLVVQEPGPFELELGIDVFGARMRGRTTLTLPISRSVVLIGNGSFEEGEAVEGVDSCRVREIRADEVVLDYKGEELRLRVGGQPGPK